MECKKCMNHKPGFNIDKFTCPECGQKWELAGEGPGDYWIETVEKEK